MDNCKHCGGKIIEKRNYQKAVFCSSRCASQHAKGVIFGRKQGRPSKRQNSTDVKHD